jgi:dipeptidyl aminopeptidase/acylaminoacyl peptidase
VLVTSAGAWLYLPGQAPPLRVALPIRGPVRAATVSPDGRWLAVVRGEAAPGYRGPPTPATTPQLQIADLTEPARAPRTLLSGIPISQPTWSPDSGWLLVAWSTADQWWFVRATGRPRIIAESRVAAKLGPGGRAAGLQIDGWCCSP